MRVSGWRQQRLLTDGTDGAGSTGADVAAWTRYAGLVVRATNKAATRAGVTRGGGGLAVGGGPAADGQRAEERRGRVVVPQSSGGERSSGQLEQEHARG